MDNENRIKKQKIDNDNEDNDKNDNNDIIDMKKLEDHNESNIKNNEKTNINDTHKNDPNHPIDINSSKDDGIYRIKINDFGYFSSVLSNLSNLNEGELFFKLTDDNLLIYAGTIQLISKTSVPFIPIYKSKNFNSYIHRVDCKILKQNNIFTLGFNCFVNFYSSSISIEIVDGSEKTSYHFNDMIIPFNVDDDDSILTLSDIINNNKNYKHKIRVNPKKFSTQFNKIKSLKEKKMDIKLLEKKDDEKHDLLLSINSCSILVSIECFIPSMNENDDFNGDIIQSASYYSNSIREEYNELNDDNNSNDSINSLNFKNNSDEYNNKNKFNKININDNKNLNTLESRCIFTEHLQSIMNKFDPTYLSFIEIYFNEINEPIQIKIVKDDNIYYSFIPPCYED